MKNEKAIRTIDRLRITVRCVAICARIAETLQSESILDRMNKTRKKKYQIHFFCARPFCLKLQFTLAPTHLHCEHLFSLHLISAHRHSIHLPWFHSLHSERCVYASLYIYICILLIIICVWLSSLRSKHPFARLSNKYANHGDNKIFQRERHTRQNKGRENASAKCLDRFSELFLILLWQVKCARGFDKYNYIHKASGRRSIGGIVAMFATAVVVTKLLHYER